MTLSLHTIKPSKGAMKKRKRVGRGDASGHGSYSTRGIKGQKSRSGVSGLKRLGLKMTLMRIPKKRGFKSFYPKDQVVNLSVINSNFKDGETVSPRSLFKKGLIDNTKAEVKILGEGDLNVKNLKFEDVKMSESVKGKIGK
jgi:large subunit ribosomal protein L15